MAFLAPIFPSITAFAATGWAASAIVKLGTMLLINAASRALMKKPTSGLRNGSTISAPVSPRTLRYGRSRDGGVLIYISEQPSNKQKLHSIHYPLHLHLPTSMYHHLQEVHKYYLVHFSNTVNDYW